MKYLRLSSFLALILACLLFMTAVSAVPDPPKKEGDAKKKAASSCERKKLGANFNDYTVPKRDVATVGESLGFAAIVVGVLAVATVNTYYKVKTNPQLPGYTQAAYMRDREL